MKSQDSTSESSPAREKADTSDRAGATQTNSKAKQGSGSAEASSSPSIQDAQKPANNTWPFPPGSQGDHTPVEVKPVQKPGWNARQFRI